jgi:hypothetical protein
MGFLLGGGSRTNAKVQRDSTVRVNSSSQGMPRALIYGQNRGSGNCIWYGFLSSRAVQSNTGGKGGAGGGKAGGTGSYTYTASFAMGLCEGPIGGLVAVWQDKSKIEQAAYVAETVLEPRTTTATVPSPTTAPVEVPGIRTTYGVPPTVQVVSGPPVGLAPLQFGLLGPLPPAGPNKYSWTTGQLKAGGWGAKLYFSADLAGKQVTISYMAFVTVDVPATGFTVFDGTTTQAPWGYLTGVEPAAALNYRGLAYVAAANYALGASAALPNLNFEIRGLFANAIPAPAGPVTTVGNFPVPQTPAVQVALLALGTTLANVGVVDQNGNTLTQVAFDPNSPFPAFPLTYAVDIYGWA